MNTIERSEDRPGRSGGLDTTQLGRAILAAGVVCATVIGASLLDGLPPAQVAQAATVQGPVPPGEAARVAEVERVLANAAVVAALWAADESSHGMRPDAAH